MAQEFANVNRPPSTLSWPIKSGEAPPSTVLPRPLIFIVVSETPSGRRRAPFRFNHAWSSPTDKMVTDCESDRENRIGLLIVLVPYEAWTIGFSELNVRTPLPERWYPQLW